MIAVALFAAQTRAAVVTNQYQQGVSPSGSYQHVGSELRGSSPTLNWGSSSLIRSGSGEPLRTVLAFDLTGFSPTDIVTNVTLQMHTNTVAHGAGDTEMHPFAAVSPTVEIHQITSSTAMVEGNGDDNGNGDALGGVTWNQIKSGTNWITPGGDFSATILASQLVENDGVTYTFASSAAFVAAAQDALVNRGGLLQLILVAPASEGFGGAFVRWDSDDASAGSSRPLLSVTASVPEPCTGVVLAGTALLFVRRRMRA